LVNASSQWRRALQTSIEQWAKLLDLPTRSEINTLTQRLKSIEAQLRTSRAPEAAPKKPRPRAATGKPRRGRRKSKT
jgi:Poly(R)-hydroxyalkanoic acid synthase subunit (PHA_synth_III_E)